MAGKKPAKGSKKPSIRQEKLIEGVLQGKSKRRAALDAGYAESTASVDVYRILEKPSVQARIQERIRESQVNTNEIIGTLVSHMRGDLAEVVPNDEFLKEAKRNGVSHLIKELEITKRQVIGANEDDPGAIETKYKIKIHDSQSAAKHLTTVFGLEKAKETHPNDVERNKREEVRKYLFEQGLLTSDTVQ
jgi:phage terminase small subunit